MGSKADPTLNVVKGYSNHPTSSSWYPSLERGCKEEPKIFPECECWECLALPQEDRQTYARWDWQQGGCVSCFLYIYDVPQYIISKPTVDDKQYMARVSFWGLDDTGLEKHFEYEEDARWFVCHLPAFISMEWLWEVGFVHC